MNIHFTRRNLFQLFAAILIILIAVLMFIIGKQHALLLDNKTVEDSGTTYQAFSIVEVQVNKEPEIELAARDRDRVDVMGQRHRITVTYTDRSFEEHVFEKKFSVPMSYAMVLISIPALVGGADESVWLQECIPPTAAVAPVSQEPEIVSDELIPTDF